MSAIISYVDSNKDLYNIIIIHTLLAACTMLNTIIIILYIEGLIFLQLFESMSIHLKLQRRPDNFSTSLMKELGDLFYIFLEIMESLLIN